MTVSIRSIYRLVPWVGGIVPHSLINTESSKGSAEARASTVISKESGFKSPQGQTSQCRTLAVDRETVTQSFSRRRSLLSRPILQWDRIWLGDPRVVNPKNPRLKKRNGHRHEAGARCRACSRRL
jgi:hypothetical protein